MPTATPTPTETPNAYQLAFTYTDRCADCNTNTDRNAHAQPNAYQLAYTYSDG